MLGLIRRYKARKAAKERWENLEEELQGNVDNAMRELWKQNLENHKLLAELEAKHKN